MFGSSSNLPKDIETSPTSTSTSSSFNKPTSDDSRTSGTSPTSNTSPKSRSPDGMASGEKRSGNGSPPRGVDAGTPGEKKRRSSSMGSKASSFLASAKQSLHFSTSPNSSSFGKAGDNGQSALQKLGKQDPALVVPQGQHNNAAGESLPSARSTFRVGVWEDKNKKCRRTMEDTHAFLYNFLHTPAPAFGADAARKSSRSDSSDSAEMMETDNGYFAIFDGHAGTFAADWCGKKLHHILEELIRKNPNSPIPELLDQTFTSVDHQLESLPVKNSGCTAVCAVLRWEDRIPNSQSATGSTSIGAATAAAIKATEEASKTDDKSADSAIDVSKESGADTTAASSSVSTGEATHAKLKSTASRQRVLYTANVGDARIVLCRGGKALRLSYDHKGSDEAEGKRISNAGGLILNNRVNGVLAVTRALGDSYMKDLVTGHPYTTETVIQPDVDEFMILACDGLWDVCQDQEAVDLIRNVQDPVSASKLLVDHALARFSTDNLSCMVVRFDRSGILDATKNKHDAIGVEGDPTSTPGKISEVDKIMVDAKRRVHEEGITVGVSATNEGKGYDENERERSSVVESVIEEEAIEDDSSSGKSGKSGKSSKSGKSTGSPAS